MAMSVLNFLSVFLLGGVTTALFITDEGRKFKQDITTMVKNDLAKARAKTTEDETPEQGDTETGKDTGEYNAQH